MTTPDQNQRVLTTSVFGGIALAAVLGTALLIAPTGAQAQAQAADAATSEAAPVVEAAPAIESPSVVAVAEPVAEEAPHEEEVTPAAVALPAITVSTVAPRLLRDRVIASGLVRAVEEVQVQPLVEGQPIDALLAEVGDRIEAGQVLARLSTASLELQRSELVASRASVDASVAQAEASLAEAATSAEEAERVSARNAELADQGTVPRAQADESRAAAEAARARVRAAEQGIASARAQGELVEAQIATLDLQLSRTEVVAPVAGLVVARNAQIGAIASASGDPMFTIVRDGALELRAEVSEQDLMRLEPGQSVQMTAMAGSEPVVGTVRLVEPTIDQTSRLGTARIAIDSASRAVQGMFLTAEILVREADAIAVPITAVGSGADGTTVMRVTDGVVAQVPVETGIRDGSYIEIVSGLTEGDLVVTKAAAFVRDGDSINPVPEDSGSATGTTSALAAANEAQLDAAPGESPAVPSAEE